MKTMQRLTSAYESARIEEFDDDSRYVIMSDCHRGDGSVSDEFLKNKNVFLAALEHYWKQGFTYIEAGDGDELWEHKYKHIIKANRAVWDLIRPFHEAGRLIRMYGNHDIQLQNPGYVRANLWTAADPDSNDVEPFLTGLEAIEALVLRHRTTGQEIFVVHGHQGDFTNDQAWRLNMLSLRYFWRYLHAFGARSPSSPTRNAYKRHKVERNYVKWIQENCIALICGHTHREKFPKHNEMPYFNSGSCLYPSHITALEIVNSAIALVRWRVDPNEDGFLQVTRRVVAGPVPLQQFDLKRHRAAANGPSDVADGSDGPRRGAEDRMDRIIEERQVSQHHITIVEELMDEGVGYAVLVDGVRIADDEPLDHLPGDDELRGILTAHGLH